MSVKQGGHVLQLVAEAKGPAGLVESGASPNAAAQALIEQATG